MNQSSHTIRHRSRAASIAVTALAIVLVIFGLPLFAGGIWLISLGGSWYYALAGAGLLATAYGLFCRTMAAVWVYLVTFAGTVVWAFWEAGFNWWAQVPRLVAPTLVLLLVLACIPALRRLGSTGKRGFLSAAVVVGALVSQGGPASRMAQAEDLGHAPITTADRAWEVRTGDMPKGDERYSNQNTPLKIGNQA